MASVTLDSLRKSFDGIIAVDDVSLRVEHGEFVVLLGPSGSGKSTIMRMIAGIEAPTSGAIWLDDTRLDTVLPRARDVAMVFQSYALYPHMSVFENIAFPLRSGHVARDEVRRRVKAVAEMLELGELLRRRPGQLSGGQQQRVALGRAIVREPRLFLLDEPLSNLDAKLRTRTRLELRALHARLDTTTLYVTHDQVEALTMGDRVAVLDKGVLRQFDEPQTVYDHPADTVVADFVGSPPMNLLPAEVLDTGPVLRLAGAGWAASYDVARLDPRVRAGLGGCARDVVLGVRPEHLRLCGAGSGELAGVVERVELLGNDRLVHVDAAGQRLAVRVPVSERPPAGSSVALAIRPAGIRLFAAGSGLRIGRPAPG